MARRRPGQLLVSEVTALRALEESPRHAYALAQDFGAPEPTIGQMLRRLTGMGLLRGRWDTGGARKGPPRLIYQLSAKGRRALRDAGGRQPVGRSGLA